MTRWIVAAAAGVGVVALVAIWTWLGRVPTDRGDSVSAAWLDEHIRGRRERRD